MKIIFSNQAWEDYLYWNATDKKVFKKINALIKECQRTPFEGIGKPELLKHELDGSWSRRIDREHRLVYRIKDGALEIAQCRHHY
ncbi:Txe/YoeB family addiction module toxin [Algoriphagus persicinus]|uniref:Txe/YoeB family addiction module toxin n=1 Tax=Algoriphagus persicinus TaxID=3108754 RepID=UPI002B3D263C|nr:Txe/YoeB family addiction module toxin [Algoriphagus sp. E1-3-M2]MEB2784883.1 Txe/YoeB family addiction module toxin [Algoriphagus sp. E1-3-M2]